jgi:predicted nuclease of predicted toxin-antitoxin system
VRVLLDENLPHDLISELGGREVVTVQGLGWAGVKNGELLRRAAGKVDAFLTMDRNLEDEHNLHALSFGVVVIRARSNRVQDLRPLMGPVTAALARIGPGKVERVGA